VELFGLFLHLFWAISSLPGLSLGSKWALRQICLGALTAVRFFWPDETSPGCGLSPFNLEWGGHEQGAHPKVGLVDSGAVYLAVLGVLGCAHVL
jgi:hypothetical protein